MPPPKITMTLLVRNEQDIIAENIRFHHALGVDNFIVMDNLSTDGTAEILKVLSQGIDIDIIFQPLDDYNQWQWVTDMARRAATVHKADWVINNDADEFWVPQGGDMKAVLGALPEQTGVLQVQRHNAVVVGDEDAENAHSGHPEHANIFERVSMNPLGKRLPGKALHRAWPTAIVAQGNHKVQDVPGAEEEAGARLKILHYPYRSLTRYKEKIRLGGAAYARNTSLRPSIGATWRQHHSTLETGGVDRFWSELAETPQDIAAGLESGRLFRDETVMTFIAKHNETPIQAAVDDLIDNTRKLVEDHCSVQERAEDRFTPKQRARRPHNYNLEFALSGPRAHLRHLTSLTDKADPKGMCAALPDLRDAFSLFPSNTKFKPFLAALLEETRPADVARLRKDCAGKRVILHTSCQPRLEDTKETIASFDALQQDNYHHIILLGAAVSIGEDETGLSFEYDGQTLRVPAPDTYEHLHRKQFYAYMLFDVLTAPEMVIKIDDNLVLEDDAKFVSCIDRVTDEKAAYAGRLVGTQMHDDQWHGWHLNKCADPVVETRGYQYPLPRVYASGGYGYVLGPEGLSACAYMYLAMKEFFNLRAVGLEDACVGHATYAKKVDLLDLSVQPTGGPRVLLALPGMATKECQKREAELGIDRGASKPVG